MAPLRAFMIGAVDSHDCPLLGIPGTKLRTGNFLVPATSALVEVVIGGVGNKCHIAKIS